MEDEDLAVRVTVDADTGALDRALSDLSGKANAFGAALTGALKSAAGGTRSLDGVLRQLGQRLSTLALDAALQPLQDLAGGFFRQALSGLGGGLAGAAPARIIPFAKGGIVAAPSYFPAGRQIGLMGEAGAEAVLPLRRGADGTLGVAAGQGGGGGAPTIVFNVSAADAPSFKRSEAQIQAMLARAVGRGRRGL